jgi:hypothetical protein
MASSAAFFNTIYPLWHTTLNAPEQNIIVLDWINPVVGYCILNEGLQTLVFGAVNSVKVRGTVATEAVHHIGIQSRV